MKNILFVGVDFCFGIIVSNAALYTMSIDCVCEHFVHTNGKYQGHVEIFSGRIFSCLPSALKIKLGKKFENQTLHRRVKNRS